VKREVSWIPHAPVGDKKGIITKQILHKNKKNYHQLIIKIG
jgi:hypothetical protein